MDKDIREYIERILKEFPRRDNVLRKLDLDIEEIKLDDGMSAICYDSVNVQTSNIADTVSSLVMRKEKEIEDILKEKNRKKIHFDKVEIALDAFTDLQQKLIEYRYFKGYNFDMCAEKIGYSVSQCKNLTYDILNTLHIGYKIMPKKKVGGTK